MLICLAARHCYGTKYLFGIYHQLKMMIIWRRFLRERYFVFVNGTLSLLDLKPGFTD